MEPLVDYLNVEMENVGSNISDCDGTGVPAGAGNMRLIFGFFKYLLR